MASLCLLVSVKTVGALVHADSIRLLGSLTNNGRKLANFTGFYKGIQSAGGAIAPAIDNRKVPYMTNLAAAWGLLAGSLIVATPVIFMKVQDTTSLEEDLRFSDETFAEVAPTEAKLAVLGGKH